MSNSFCLLFLAALVLSCHGDDFNGYSYPKPNCPLALPVTLTETQFQTQYQTSTVQVPVYYTSTVTEQQLITSYDTIISTNVQYLTATSTIFITPTPVTVSATVVTTATVACAAESVSGIGSVATQPDNSYLPPPSGLVSSETSGTVESSNAYLPPPVLPDINNGNAPTGPAPVGPTGRSLNFNSFGLTFVPSVPLSLNLGALPPRA